MLKAHGSTPSRGLASFAWTSGGRLSLQVANLVALTVTSRLIAPEEFGLFAPVAILAAFVHTVSDGTFATALMQRSELKDDHVRVSIWAGFITSIAVTALLVVTAPSIERGFGFEGLAGVIVLSAFMLPARLVSTVPMALLQRQMRFREIALVAFVTAMVGRILPTIVLAVYGFGVWALVAGYVIQSYLDVAILLYLARPRVGWPGDWRCARDVWRFGGRFMAIQVVNQMALNIDNIVVGRLLGPAALGFHSRAVALMMLPVNLLGTSAQQVLFPRFSRLQDDRKRLQSEMYAALDLVTGLILPLAIFLTVVADSLVLLVLGETWTPVILPTRILFATIAFRIGYKVTETVSFATAALTPSLIRQCGYAVLITVGALIGSRWGLTGVAIGLGLALLLFYTSSLQAAVGLVNGSWPPLAALHARGALIAVLAVAPASVVASLGSHSLSARVGADAAAGLLFCLSMALIMFKGPPWLAGASGDVVRGFASRIGRKVKAMYPPQLDTPGEEGVL